MKQHLAKIMGQPKQGAWFKKMKSFVLITTTCFLLDVLGVISKCSKVFHKDMIDIDQMQSILVATVSQSKT